MQVPAKPLRLPWTEQSVSGAWWSTFLRSSEPRHTFRKVRHRAPNQAGRLSAARHCSSFHCGDGQLAGVEPRPGVAGMAVDGRLQIDLPDAIERADEEDVHGDEGACMRGLEVTIAELGREAFEETNLFSVSSILRSAVHFSSLSRRSCLVSRPWRRQKRSGGL